MTFTAKKEAVEPQPADKQHEEQTDPLTVRINNSAFCFTLSPSEGTAELLLPDRIKSCFEAKEKSNQEIKRQQEDVGCLSSLLILSMEAAL